MTPIGTKVVAYDGFSVRIGQVADHTTNKWGTWHVVLIDGQFESAVGNIGPADMKGIGWRVATPDDIKRGTGYRFGPAYTGD
jgi:hypothetical protein